MPTCRYRIPTTPSTASRDGVPGYPTQAWTSHGHDLSTGQAYAVVSSIMRTSGAGVRFLGCPGGLCEGLPEGPGWPDTENTSHRSVFGQAFR